MNVQDYAAEFENEAKQTRKLLERIPAEKFDWTPHEKSMSMGRLASHTADIPDWCAEVVTREALELKLGPSGKFESFSARTSEELLSHFDAKVAAARQALETTDEEQLKANWSLLFNGQPLLTDSKQKLLRHMVLNHLIHHRGQLSVYLRLNDIPVPALYGPSADEK